MSSYKVPPAPTPPSTNTVHVNDLEITWREGEQRLYIKNTSSADYQNLSITRDTFRQAAQEFIEFDVAERMLGR